MALRRRLSTGLPLSVRFRFVGKVQNNAGLTHAKPAEGGRTVETVIFGGLAIVAAELQR
jgi:hypothetical protein